MASQEALEYLGDVSKVEEVVDFRGSREHFQRDFVVQIESTFR